MIGVTHAGVGQAVLLASRLMCLAWSHGAETGTNAGLQAGLLAPRRLPCVMIWTCFLGLLRCLLWALSRRTSRFAMTAVTRSTWLIFAGGRSCWCSIPWMRLLSAASSY